MHRKKEPSLAKALRLAKGVQTLLAKRPDGKRQQRRTQTVPFSKCGARIKFALKHVSRTFAIAPKASFETPGEYAFLSLERKRRCAPHPPPKKTCLLQRSIKWLLGPRLGKTDRCCASSSKGKDRTKDVPATAIVLSTFQKDPLLTNSNIR